ncbi:immunoglobulin kappa light chain-like [Channa argus]|uniref:immunoglobulin kappa light chain-like n=1 Tax=Channa argus TaxID=215402 RepID=UPI00352142D1
MTTSFLVFFLTYLFCENMAQMTELKSVHQENGFVSVIVGGEVTLQCFYEGVASRLYWFKQTLGQKPRLISTFYNSERNGVLYNEFYKNPRFTLDNKNGETHLKIKNVLISDSATYYCVSSYTYNFEFGEGTTVSVKGSALFHQSVSGTIQPGGSVTLHCTVHTGTCDGEHRVYWFKDTQPGIIYTHGDRNSQCETKPETQTHTCIYNLPMKNLNLSHAGTYHCAVASCGHIVFGKGIQLNFEYKVETLILVNLLSGALIVSMIFSIVLAFILYKMNKRKNSQSTEPQSRLSVNSESYQDVHNLHYSSLRVDTARRPRRQWNTNRTECLYSNIKQ